MRDIIGFFLRLILQKQEMRLGASLPKTGLVPKTWVRAPARAKLS